MASKTTKTVSVRLPMDYYFKILEETSKNNITISDYILMRIHSNISNEDIFNNQSDKSKEELIDLRNELSKKQEEIKRTNEILQTYHNALNDFKEYYEENKIKDVYEKSLIQTFSSDFLLPENFDDEKQYDRLKTFKERYFSIDRKLEDKYEKLNSYLIKK